MSADDSNSCLHLVVESRITPLLFFQKPDSPDGKTTSPAARGAEE